MDKLIDILWILDLYLKYGTMMKKNLNFHYLNNIFYIETIGKNENNFKYKYVNTY